MIGKRHRISSKKHIRWYSCLLLALIMAATCALPLSVFADSENGTEPPGTGTDNGPKLAGAEEDLTVVLDGGERDTVETTITIYKTTTGDKSFMPKKFSFRVVRVSGKDGKTELTGKDDETVINNGATVTVVAGPNVTTVPVNFTIKNLTLPDDATDGQEQYYYKVSEIDDQDSDWKYDKRAFVLQVRVYYDADGLQAPQRRQEWFYDGYSYDLKGGGDPTPPNEYNTFINEYAGPGEPSGTLNVKKSDFSKSPAYPEETFQFTLKNNGKPFDLTTTGVTIQKVGQNGNYGTTDLKNGVFTLSYNTHVRITGLPDGEYTVSEYDAGYKASYVLNSGTSVTSNTATVVIKGDSNNSVLFTNEETGSNTSLTIEKLLEGAYDSWGVGNSTTFRAKVKDARGRYLTFSGTGPKYTYTGTSATGSEIRFSKNQPATVVGIPIGTECTVEEILSGGTPCQQKYSNKDVKIPETTNVTIVVTNTYAPDDREVGDITINKKLAGSAGDWGVDENTVFTAKIRDVTVAGDVYDLHFKRLPDGNYEAVPIGTGNTEVQFTAGKPVKLTKLWTDRIYAVEETGGAGYTANYSVNNVKLPKGGNIDVTITNTYGPGTGNLVISKKLAGSPGDWGVDENTIFTARVKDISANEYVMLKHQGGRSYIFDKNNSSASQTPDPNEIVRFYVGSPAVISGLNPSHNYLVEEQGSGAHFTAANSSNNVSLQGGGNVNVTVTNTYEHGTGNLIIRKKLEGLPAEWNVDGDTKFYVRVKDADDKNYLLFKYNESDGTYHAFANSGSSMPGTDSDELVTLTAGYPAILTGLWANHEYVVEEDAGAYYRIEYEGNNQKFPESGNMNVTVINTYEQGKGRLVISKKLAGSPGDWGVNENTEFWVRVKELPEGNYVLFDLQPDGGYKANGNSESKTPTGDTRELVRITARRSYEFRNLEPGCEYMVEEVGGARYTAAYAGNNTRLLEDSNMNVVITNTFEPEKPGTTTNTNEPGKGSLVISKRLAGRPGDWGVDGDTVFAVRVKDITNGKYVLLTLQPDGSYLAVGKSNSGTQTNDSRELAQLTSGNPITINGLQSNCVYAVEEAGGAHYTAAYAGNDVMLQDGSVINVTITNTYGRDGDGGGDDGGDGDDNGNDKGRLVIRKANFDKTPAKPHEVFTFFVKKNGDPVDLTAVGVRIRKTGGSGEYVAADLRKGSFTLTYDTEITIDGLPLGKYTVAEYAVGYIKSCELIDKSRVETDGIVITDITVIFTNEEIDGDSPRPDDGSAEDYFEVEIPLIPLAEMPSSQGDTEQSSTNKPQPGVPITGIGTTSELLFLLLVLLLGAAVFIYFRIREIKKTID